MKEAFIERAFAPKSVAVIEKANEIIRAYQAQGFTLTLRQLYYQFVSRDLIANRQSEYKRLGSIINDARLAGLIDWRAIEDRTRNVRGGDGWAESPQHYLESVAEGYSEALWDGQPRHIEVWIEKDALIGVIEPVCDRWRLPYLACRGYVSQSEQYAAGKRFEQFDRLGRSPVVLYLGDHDASGVDMSRDHTDRLAMFARWPVEVRRVALNLDQIEAYDPPPNPTKDTDSRAGVLDEQTGEYPEGSYRRMMVDAGQDPDTCWELDALEPSVIDSLIEGEVQALIDREAWDAAKEAETENRFRIVDIAHRWSEIVDFLGDDEPEDQD